MDRQTGEVRFQSKGTLSSEMEEETGKGVRDAEMPRGRKGLTLTRTPWNHLESQKQGCRLRASESGFLTHTKPHAMGGGGSPPHSHLEAQTVPSGMSSSLRRGASTWGAVWEASPAGLEAAHTTSTYTAPVRPNRTATPDRSLAEVA